MPRAPLVEILRYAASGYIFLLYLYIANREAALELADLGEVTIALGSLAVGALTYIVHRGLIFKLITRYLRDTRPPTYRSWLTKKYRLKTPDQAILLYAAVRPLLRKSPEVRRPVR